jgi:hypothetical protein
MGLGLIAAIGAGIGAVTGGISTYLQGEKQKKLIEQQRKAALSRLADGGREARNAFARAKAEAGTNAAAADRNLDRRAGLLETAYDRLSGDYNLSMAAMGLEQNAARIGVEQGSGAAYSDLGYSGVRSGSSNYAAAASQDDLYQKQFASALTRQAAADESALRQTLQGYDNAFYGIAEGRREASLLRASYEEGGLQRQAYKDQMQTLANERERIETGAADAAELAAPGVLDYITGIAGGASSGFNLGSGIDEWWTTASWNKPGGATKAGGM